jgi:hypothetical protein
LRRYLGAHRDLQADAGQARDDARADPGGNADAPPRHGTGLLKPFNTLRHR